ncbi:MAG: helix-turn-helix transcriptional regulator, partial [Dehalococcoidia bacterium]
MSSRPSHLETRYKHDLTPRQEQVMRMITAGRTNAEIAAALDISLDGAKYHVREILSKVGAESREEAVEIWRSGHRGPWRRLGSALAGLIPSSGVGRVVAGGGAVTVTAVAITWVGLSQQGSPAAMLPPCDPWALALSLQPTSGAAGASYALEVGNPGQPCHVYERVGFEVLGPTGSLLSGLNNNGPTTNVDARLDRSLTVGTWTWDQWCGRDGPFTARALLGAATSPAVAVAAPPCATVSVPPSVTFDDGRPARVDVADCRAYSQVCDMAEVAAGW